ncbi:MAG: LTA synthase family protein [Lachnospiraceae bacterium]|nr:LTA synthase family protein [Lachnospiraceae bacterium]
MSKLKAFFNNQIYRKNIFWFIVLPFLLELVIEMLNRGSVIGGFKFLFTSFVPFFCNMMIILATLSIGLLVKKRSFYLTFVSAVWLFFGIVNRVLLTVRVTPFNAADLKLMDAAANIIDQYFTPFLIFLTMILIALAIFIIVMLFIKGPVVGYKINYWKNLIIIGVAFLICIGSLNVAMETGFLAKKFTNLTNAYNQYGFIYCFGSGMFNTGVKKPSNYSQDTIDEILNKIDDGENVFPGKEEDKEVTRTPNIIFLQLESFFDINQVTGIEFSTDPIPYFNKLKEEFPSGYLNVFNIGYGTCNTEFEIMTSMNLDDFGPGEMPYKSILKDQTCESVVYDLKEYGYVTHAIHNNDATFYTRKTVFSNLGFDTFTSIEYMDVEEYTYENWAKDKYLTEEIIKCLKMNDDPDYIYTISVQGHGSYPTSKVIENPEVTILSGVADEGRKNAIEYYSNQIHEMDLFLEELTTALEELGEETILVMYGDHLPGLGFSDDDMLNGSIYQTEYIVWNNFDLKMEDEDIETYQLSPKILGALDMTAGVINNFHQQYKDDEEYLSGLQNLEYDILFGDQLAYGGVSPYNKTQIQMGIDEIKIDEIREVIENDKKYVDIIGENFTKYSVVYINNDIYDTEFIDKSTLRVKYDKLSTLDSFVVSQVDKDSGYVLSSTKESLYYGTEE